MYRAHHAQKRASSIPDPGPALTLAPNSMPPPSSRSSASNSSASSSSFILDRFSSSLSLQNYPLCSVDAIFGLMNNTNSGQDHQQHGMVEISVPGLEPAQRVLLVRLGSIVDELFALSPDCANCNSPLIKGVLCKNRIRCCIHGTAYNIRTGILVDGVGLNSIWSSRMVLVDSYLFADFHPKKFGTLRAESCPIPRPITHSTKLPIVVVGAGIAGVTCVETLRQLSYAGPIIMISKEAELPYDRKSLSKRLCDTKNPDEDNRALRSREFYEQNLGVQLWLGCVVKGIRTEEKCVLVEDHRGSENPTRSTANINGSTTTATSDSAIRARLVQYAELVLAMGATSRRLHGVQGAERLEGILYVRTMDDGRRLAEEVSGRNVAIIGSGFLGFELACIISPRAKSVSIYGKSANPLTIFGSTVGREIRNYMQEEGVGIRQDTVLRSMDGWDRVQQLTFRDGLTIVADLVIVVIGVMPPTSMLMGSGIRTNSEGFVLVDERMRTNVAGVHACGDCTNFPMADLHAAAATAVGGGNAQQALPPRRVNLPHWQIAQHQARTVAYSIVGIDYVPRLVPFIWTHLFNRHITFSGDPTAEPDERIQRGTLMGNDYVVYCVKRDRVIGVLSCGPANVAVQFIELFRRGRLVTKEEVLRNKLDQWQDWE